MHLPARALALLLLFPFTPLSASGSPSKADFDWTTVEPSTRLNYTECYDGLRCARLLVPLDYWTDEVTATVGATATIAILTLPATVPASDPSFGGTIISNPGGPGGSGVALILAMGQQIRDMVDGPDRHYEILSFDPRGVGHTIPGADCYGGDEFARAAARLRRRAAGGYDEGLPVVRRHFASAYGLGRLCERDASAFVGTASVARDMVEMVDRIAELRAAEGRDGGGDGRGGGSDDALRFGGQRPLGGMMDGSGQGGGGGSNGEEEEEETAKIQYYGFSYGTVLGNTFASMYPDRVGRMILDGVEDIYDYYSMDWALNLADTEKVIDYFYERCFQAGPDRCRLARRGDAGAADVRARVDGLVAELVAAPATFLAAGRDYVVTHHDVLLAMFRPIYSPLDGFAPLADILADAMAGNFTALLRSLDLPRAEQSCPVVPGVPFHDDYTWMEEARSAIACGDGDDITAETPARFTTYAGRLRADSPTFGDRWADIRIACVGWRRRPAWRFTGPFGAPGPAGDDDEGDRRKAKTAAPLLFTSTRLDPVTPLRNAYAMAKLFPGSSVVVQEAAGHCSLSSPSACMKKIIQRYFETGTSFLAHVVPRPYQWAGSCVPFRYRFEFSVYSC